MKTSTVERANTSPEQQLLTEPRLTLHALAQVRATLGAIVETLKSQPGGQRLADAVGRHLDQLDFATTGIAELTGGSVIPGGGVAPDASLSDLGGRWVVRGKRERVTPE